MDFIKKRVMDYWSLRAEGFEAQRLREFESLKRGKWLQEIVRYLPDGKPLRILDIGTGTGFFACLLTAEGHDVIGIDLAPNMIEHAVHMAGTLGLSASFRVMDAEAPEFENESFDALVTRNLTWTLPHLDKAYGSWYRILKPGGVLINFDADYYAALNKEDTAELPAAHAHMQLPDSMMKESDAITREIGRGHGSRPLRDIELLMRAGYESISVDLGVHKRLYAEIDEFYNPVPVFAVTATKASV